jgi:hypothetical protein
MTELNETQLKLAQIGYEGYAEQTEGLTFDGRQMPSWAELPDRTRTAWAMAAMRIVSVWENQQAIPHPLPLTIRH